MSCLIAVLFVSSAFAGYVDANNVQYESLDYIKSSGNQWIVTDIMPTCTDRVKMKFRLTTTGTTQCLYCSRGTDTSTDTFTAFYIDNIVRCDRNTNTSTLGQTQPTTAEDCTLDADYETCKFYVNGTLQSATMATGSYTPGSALMLFASHKKGSALSDSIAATDVANKGSYQLFYFELYASGSETPKHRLMPARRTTDSAVGLYDVVSGTFYGPASQSAAFAGSYAVTNVVARQRYPWNGLVDLHFTITGDAGTQYDTSFTAKDMVGNTNITMRTIRKANGSAAATKEQLLPGTYSWVWDAAADLPKDWKSDRVTVTGTANEFKPLYMVIDLSGGANASSYPVSYLDDMPSGGWGSTYKTTKLVLRKCSKGKDPKGRYTLTKDFYIGIFEVTCKQYYLVMGSWPSGHSESDASKPADKITWNTARGNNWPSNVNPASSSFTGKLRNRSGELVDLPTEAQWEYACRAGTTSSFNNGGNTEADLKKVGNYRQYDYDIGEYNYQTKIVGSYKANSWGIYDMHGNLWELCLDWYGSSSPSGTDPKGPSSGTYRVSKGGSLYTWWSSCTSSSRIQGDTGNDRFEDGFRVCINFSE